MLKLYAIKNEIGQFFGGFKPPYYKPIWVDADSAVLVLTVREDADEIASNQGGKVVVFQEVVE
jgi:hypothetical protein